MKLTREFYIPKSSTKVTDKASDAVAYLFTNARGNPCASLFVGKQAKPLWSYRFGDTARRSTRIGDAFKARQEQLSRKAEARQRRKAVPGRYKVGDVFKRVWGYDQTNVDYYEVVEARGAYVWVRDLAQEHVTTDGGWTGKTTPLPGVYRDNKPAKKCLAQDGRIKINGYAHAYYEAPKIVAGVPTYGVDNFSTYA
ncbi:hypothetical protein [Afipia carboxidovorans]|uniref:hypothetical protein n=1 Tax=Afipia carboxidovorans TaxID=40137 RepID=UPI00308E7E5A|nr:hypothetical protein CRBSH125_05860 [Afipia carboxidovorans]